MNPKLSVAKSLISILLRGLVAVSWATALPGAESVRRPNVILILSDDQGSVDLSCYGTRDIETPHTDALAARGVRFTQFYSAAPICSPSRAGVLTGRYPARVGVTDNVASQRGGKGALAPEEITMAEMFKAAGYATAHIGKWHLGYTPATMPNAQGFDYSFGHMGGCIDNYSHFFYWVPPNVHDLYRNGTEVYHNGEFFPDLMLREAKQFMQKSGGRPFFMYYAMNTPHYPYQGDPKWLEKFKHLPYPRNLYAAFLAAQDERLGLLFDSIDALGLRENTLIVFMADNGHSTEDRAHHGGGSAGQYRGAKFSMFEGGIRVPALISWPGRIPQNETREQVVHACDLLPTIADLTGIQPPQAHLDGRSISSVLENAKASGPHADSALHWQIFADKNTEWAVRLGDWKLTGNTRDTGRGMGSAHVPLFLANLREDPSETVNLAEMNPNVVARLLHMHENYLAKK